MPRTSNTPTHTEADDIWDGVAPDAARRLIASAVDLFADRGFNATTTRDIAVRAGMSPAAIYTYYTSKDELLFEISKVGHEAVLKEVIEARTGADGTVGQLRAFVVAFVAWHARNHRLARVIQYELRSLDGERHEEIRQLRNRFETTMHQDLVRGVADGVFFIPDCRTTMIAILSLGIDVARWYGSRSSPPEVVADDYANLVLRMVGATT